MAIPNFYLEPANHAADMDELHFVRTAVFVDEQHIPPEIEFDALDRDCHHVLARDLQCQPIGTGRLTADGRIGRMAVLKPWRRQGVGTSILHSLLDKALSLGFSQISLCAQLDAIAFYQRFGFVACGEVLMQAGIAHQSMQLTLQPKPPQAARPGPKARVASVDAMHLQDIDSILQASLQLVEQSRRRLSILSRALDVALFGQAPMVEGIKQFVLGHRDACVQIIIQEPFSLRNQYHPLLELAQKLPSYFQLRSPLESEDIQHQSAFMLNDHDGYLFRLQGDRYAGHWSPSLPARSRPLREEFEAIWQRCRPCSEFRALGL